MISVDIVIHHRLGSEVRTTTIKGVERQEAERFITGLGRLRADNGIVTVTGKGGLEAGIPAQNIEFVQITGGTWS